MRSDSGGPKVCREWDVNSLRSDSKEKSFMCLRGVFQNSQQLELRFDVVGDLLAAASGGPIIPSMRR
jgi:hypothetical protein